MVIRNKQKIGCRKRKILFCAVQHGFDVNRICSLYNECNPPRRSTVIFGSHHIATLSLSVSATVFCCFHPDTGRRRSWPRRAGQPIAVHRHRGALPRSGQRSGFVHPAAHGADRRRGRGAAAHRHARCRAAIAGGRNRSAGDRLTLPRPKVVRLV